MLLVVTSFLAIVPKPEKQLQEDAGNLFSKAFSQTVLSY